MSAWDDITNAVNSAVAAAQKGVGTAVGDVSKEVNKIVPGSSTINKIGSDIKNQFTSPAGQNVLNGPSAALNDVQNFLSPQGWLGSQFPFNALPGGGGGSSKPPAKKAATTTTGGGQQTAPVNQMPDALTQGLGMFFSQYLAPQMAQINASNNQMISQWGDAMNYALAQPLPAGVKAIMQPWVGQNQQMLGMINQAAAQQANSTIPYTQFLNTVGNQTTAMQAMTEAFTKAATEQELGISNPTALQTAISQSGGLPAGLGALVQMLGNTSTLPGVPGVSGSGTSGTGTQKSTTPINITQSSPTSTPTATNTGAASAINSQLAQQIAASLMQQNTAAAANAAAGAGYTP